MTTKTNPTPSTVRAWLTENAIDAPWTSLAICEGLLAARPEVSGG